MKQNRAMVTVFLLLAMTTVMVAFQNCGDLRPTAESMASAASIEARYQKDRQTVAKFLGSTDFKVWVSTLDSNISESNLGFVTQIGNLRTGGMSLEPEAGALGPALVPSPLGGRVMVFNSDSSLGSPSGATLRSQNYTVIALMEAAVSGPIVTLNAGSVHTEEIFLGTGSGALSAVRYTDGSSFSTLGETYFGQGNGLMVVGASFGKDAGAIAFQINGRVVGPVVTDVGTPIDASLLERKIVLGGGDLRLGELMIFNQALSASELNTMERYIADRWHFPGVIYDPRVETGGGGGGGDSDALPTDVKRIIMSCATAACHQHAAWQDFKVSSFKADTVLVKPGNALGSALYYRLIGSEGSQGPKSMPQGGSISSGDVAIIKNWINGLQ